jgi:Holliday junction resolvase RusA-like endonuclease
MEEQYYLQGINPEPWEAPTASMARHRQTKKLYISMTKSSQLRVFQEAVQTSFKETYPEVIPGTEECEIDFLLWRRLAQSDAGDRKIRAHIADATNLQKALEDALQGILFVNDSQIRRIETIIMEQNQEVEPAILIRFRPDFVKPSVGLTGVPQGTTVHHPDNLRDFKPEDVF